MSDEEIIKKLMVDEMFQLNKSGKTFCKKVAKKAREEEREKLWLKIKNVLEPLSLMDMKFILEKEIPEFGNLEKLKEDDKK